MDRAKAKSLRRLHFSRGTAFPSVSRVNRSFLRRAADGFSLIEIMVVLVLMGALLSAAGPAASGYIGRFKTRNALNQIAADLVYTRMAAVRSGSGSSMRFTGSSMYSIELAGGVSNPVKSVSLDREYAGIVVLPPVSTLTFNSRGLLTSAAGTGHIVVSFGALRDSLVITPAGRVYRDF